MEKGFELTEELKKRLDAKYPSPQVRSEKIHAILLAAHPDGDNLPAWDLVCYAAGLLIGVVNLYPWMKKPILDIAHAVRFSHYYMYNEVENESGSDDAGSKGDASEVNDERGV